MTERILLPLACLVFGSLGGYWFGHSSPDQPVASTKRAASSASTPTAKAEAKPSPEAEKARSQQELYALADDYSAKRGRRYADGLALSDLPSAIASLAARPKEPSTLAMRMELIRSWAQRDPDGAWKAALATTNARERTSMLSAVAGEIAKTKPDSAIKLALALGKPTERTTVLRALLSDWGTVNVSAAVAYISTHPELPIEQFTLSSIISASAAKDPAKAAQLALSIKQTDYNDNGLGSSLKKWVETDAAGARRWIEGVTDPLDRDRALKAYASALVESDPSTALAALDGITSLTVRQDAQRSILSAWVRSDPDTAVAYLNSQDKNSDLGGWVSYSMDSLSAPEQARVLSGLKDGPVKADVVRGMVRNATRKGHYPKAVEMLNSMGESTVRDRSLHELAVDWGKANPQTLATWLGQQQDSSDRDLLMAGYTTSLAATDPSAALKLAIDIPDKSVQKTAVENVLSNWLRSDQGTAKAWLDASRMFSTREKARIIESSARSFFYPSSPRVSLKR
jgi:hypothetical protein